MSNNKMSNNNKVNLGDKVIDSVTGFQGIVVAETLFLNGCTRIGVQSDKLKDGLPTDAQWFDAPQLSVLEEKVVLSGNRDTGGPMSFIPKRAVDTKR